MLSEEEKEAIERLEKRIKDNEDYKTTQVWLTDDIAAVDTVLNLITNLQKENEEKNGKIEKYLDIISKKIIDVLKDELVQLKNKELDSKDKQIDLMVEYIDKIDVSEDICEGKTMCDENCKDCIKQYFERKVEEC